MLNSEIISTTVIYTGESRSLTIKTFLPSNVFHMLKKKTSRLFHCADTERSKSQPPDQNVIQARETRPDLAEKYQLTIPYIHCNS